MKIDIIHPAHYRDDGTIVQSKNLIDRLGAYLPHLGPPLMAALTPDKHEVRLVEEYLEDIDFESDADVVALSGQIMQLQRCVDISGRFRAAARRRPRPGAASRVASGCRSQGAARADTTR